MKLIRHAYPFIHPSIHPSIHSFQSKSVLLLSTFVRVRASPVPVAVVSPSSSNARIHRTRRDDDDVDVDVASREGRRHRSHAPRRRLPRASAINHQSISSLMHTRDDASIGPSIRFDSIDRSVHRFDSIDRSIDSIRSVHRSKPSRPSIVCVFFLKFTHQSRPVPESPIDESRPTDRPISTPPASRWREACAREVREKMPAAGERRRRGGRRTGVS